MYKDIRYKIRDFLLNRKYRKKLKNHDFSIICSDCTAGCICKDLKMRMNSPTRNFYFNADDYIKFCQNIDYYLELVPEEYTGNYEEDGREYLMAELGDLKLFLVHYDSVSQFKEEWNRRKKRINKENIYFLMNDRNFCTEKHIKAFDELPYKNKICFTHIEYPQYKSTYYIEGSESDSYLKPVTNYVHEWWIKRYYDDFDFVNWINNGI